ncbi:ATP-dependent DNA ligase [Bacillus salipaludis]|uniref:ATP-dependent DNA ligase n=1 Tax=Bacillus salipaludis TaxID=2547811 RepID=A0A4R5VKD2_9BACI|nr:RNA ligase family protein [Bacillus salipaludis]TDK58125.1 ATP-dependent DNA ligase [Bacillus salipaludis]
MFISPMLLERVDQPFDSDEYITELKLDGIRLLLSKFNNKIHLYTRHNNEVTALFKEIYENLNIPDGTILDGELIVPGTDGAPNFEAVMERFKSKNSSHYLQYCVFDILYYKGQKVTQLPLLERKKLLAELEFDEKRMVHVQWIEGNGIPYFNLVKERGLEGIVLKKKDSKYEINKRSNHWQKVINYSYQDVYLTGMNKKDHSFLLSSIEDGTNIGVMEFVPNQERKYIHEKVRDIGAKETDKLIIFNEGIKCNVKFRNWTSNQKLRIPSFHKWIS